MSPRFDALGWGLVALSWALTLYFWPQLPSPMPIHWGLTGQPDGFAPLPWGALIGPLTTTGLYLLMRCLPRLDPRGVRLAVFPGVLRLLAHLFAAFGAGLTYLTLQAATSPSQTLNLTGLFVGLALFFVVLGNELPKLRSNFFVGVRTPWTLSSERVWSRTHRLMGRWLVALGLAMLLAPLLPPIGQLTLVVGGLLLWAAAGIGYSYWLYRRETAA